jgi:beta-lactamase regulating signal transducer with metallopeptidase domain
MSSMIESFDSLARLLLEALLNTLWQGMLIAALVWLLLRFIKRLSATTRHAVWLVTLLTIGALPFVAVVVNRNLSIPKLSAPVKQEPAPAVQTTPVSPALEIGQPTDPFSLNNEIARLDAAANRGKIGYEFGAPRLSEQKLEDVEQKFDGVAGTHALKDESGAGAATAVAPSLKPESKSLWLRARSLFANVFSGPAPVLLIGLWLIMCALMAWRMASSYRAVFRLRGRLEPTPPEQHRRVERLAARFGIKRRVRAFTSGEIVMPMTVGSLKPLIILPPDLAGDLSQAEFESVVAHELAHIKRWDYLTNLLQRVAQAYLFFHPAVWFICKQLMIERELACDDWAVKTCEPRRYASCLTKLVEALNGSKPHMAMRVAATGIGGIIFGKHVISRRVEMILNRDRNATTAVSKPALLYAIGLVVMFVAVCSLISPVIAVPLGQKPPKQSKKESKPVAPARSQEIPSPQPATTAPPAAAPLIEAPDALDIPDTPEPPDAPSPAAAVFAPDAPFTPFPGVVVQPAPAIPGLLGQGMGVGQGMGIGLGQGAQATTITPAPGSPLSVITVGQENRQPVIPENELIGLLVDVVKRDADLNVRNEALQGLCRLRSDTAINALIQLYDSSADAKVKGEIIPYLMRREGRDSKVDNSKAIAKLTAIAKSEQNEDLRRRAIRQLANVKGDEGADTLIQIYDTLQDPRMKQSVIASLASNRSRKAIDKLIQIAKNDSDPNVRRYAIQSLYNVDSRQYLELIDRDRPRIGRVDGQFFTPMPNVMAFPTPRVFEQNWDSKNWEEWQREWRKNWEEQSERIREMIEKIRIDGVEKLRIEDLQNRLRIEMPRIEIQLKDLENKVRIGYGQDCAAAAESQLRTQLAAVEAQLTALRARYTDADPKTSEMRNLRNALERQLNSVRSMRSPGLRRAPAPGRSVTSSAPTGATPSTAPKAKTASTVNTTAISF